MKKSKMKRKLTLLLSLVIVMIVSTGCVSTYDSFKHAFFDKNDGTVETIKFGVIEPKTGTDSAMGTQEIRGIQIANEMFPQVLGKDIELVYADTQSDIEVAEVAVSDLVANEPVIVLGGYGEVVSLTASSILHKARIPAIGTTSSNPLIVDNNPYYYRVSFQEALQGTVIAEYIVDSLKQKTAALVRVKGDESTTTTNGRFVNKMNSLVDSEDSAVDVITVDPESPDYNEYVDKLVKSGVKAVFMSTSTTVADEFFEACHDKLKDVTFIGPNSWHNEDFIHIALKYPLLKLAVVSDVVNTAPENLDIDLKTDVETTNLHDELARIYTEKYETEELPEATALAFDAYYVAVKAIEKANSTEAKAIKKQLDKVKNIEGASGNITFNSKGEASKTLNIDMVVRNKFVTVYTSK